jgi:HAD superfamily hydrolase (TIGR01484 family)
MRYHVLATDYDGTLARDGRVDETTVAALERVRRSGRRLVMLTGRQLDELATVFPRLDLFDHVVAENGAVVHRPATRETRAIAEPPPDRFVAALRARGVEPLAVGKVIVATWRPHEDAVLDVIRESGLELQVIFNKGAVMVLPSGVNKALGLATALDELELSPHNAVGVGDAENDHAFLAACECAVAVANALPSLKDRADLVTTGEAGAGVQELASLLVDGDLAGLERPPLRHAIPLGVRPDGADLSVGAYGAPMLIAGPSGAGKSTIATRFLECLAERGYQFCVVDPEGDYRDVEHATVVGDASAAPRVEEALELLARPAQSCVVNLLGIPVDDRPAFFDAFLPRLQQMRARSGRPHWLVVDEAHHLMPAAWRPASPAPLHELHGLLLVTVHPESVAPDVVSAVGAAVAVGPSPLATLERVARAAGVPPPRGAEAADGRPLAWLRVTPDVAIPFDAARPRGERRRHLRKYAAGDLGEEKSFYFRGPGEKLKLRARNLQTFLQLADGVDDATWQYHLARGDYSRWFHDAIKDAELAADAARVERDDGAAPAESRARIRSAIERRYTASA